LTPRACISVTQGYAIPNERVIAVSPIAFDPIKTKFHEAGHVLVHRTEGKLVDGPKQTLADDDQAMRADAERQQRRIDERVRDQQDSLAELRQNSEATKRFFDQIEIDKGDGERIKRERLDSRTADSDITDARQRFLEAASERFDIRRPEASLSETVGVEGARAKHEHHDLTVHAQMEKDDDKRADSREV
jgi:hypothetical protein